MKNSGFCKNRFFFSFKNWGQLLVLQFSLVSSIQNIYFTTLIISNTTCSVLQLVAASVVHFHASLFHPSSVSHPQFFSTLGVNFHRWAPSLLRWLLLCFSSLSSVTPSNDAECNCAYLRAALTGLIHNWELHFSKSTAIDAYFSELKPTRYSFYQV